MLTHPKYRPDIDGLRAIAVLSVVLYHYFPIWVKGGFIGVDIFFVISGFLISSIIFSSLDAGKFSFLEFYGKRIRRIFPALAFLLLSCLVAGWFLFLKDEYVALTKHIACGVAFVSNFCLWQESGYFDTSADTKPLLHLWSLGIEEQFYLAWPFLVFIAWKLRFNKIYPILLIVGVSFLLNILRINGHAVEVFYSPLSRFWELSIGSLLAYLILYKPNFISNVKYKNTQSLLGIALILIGLAVITKDDLFPGWLALFPAIGTFFIISAGSKAWINRNILSNRILVWFGLISFPLYLWHWLIVSFATILESVFPTREIRMCLVFVSIIMAWLTYKLVEKPIRYGKNTRANTVMLCVVMLAILGSALYANQSKNLRVYFQIDEKLLEPFNWKVEWEHEPSCNAKFPDHSTCLQTFPDRKPDAMIIGDSHANHYYIGISEYFKKIDKNLLHLGSPSCVPFFDLQSGTKGAVDFCVERMKTALNYAINEESVKTIILSSRGVTYISGNGFGDIDYANRVIKLTTKPELTNAAEVFATAMRETLSRLSKTGKQIIFIVDTPELGFYPKSCVLPRNIFRGNHKICAVGRKEFDERNKQYLETIESVLKDFPKVFPFYTSKYLCDEQYCWAIKDNVVLYQDDDHLSYDGSLFIGEKFAEEAIKRKIKF